MFGLAFLAPLMGVITPILGQLAQVGPALQTAGQWALKNWRYVAIGVLLAALLVQRGCYTKLEGKFTAEKQAHATDVQTAKVNQAKADAAVKTANASIDAVALKGRQDTAAAEAAARDAQARAVTASKTAAAILARKPLKTGVCPSIHQLRLDTQ